MLFTVLLLSKKREEKEIECSNLTNKLIKYLVLLLISIFCSSVYNFLFYSKSILWNCREIISGCILFSSQFPFKSNL